MEKDGKNSITYKKKRAEMWQCQSGTKHFLIGKKVAQSIHRGLDY